MLRSFLRCAYTYVRLNVVCGVVVSVPWSEGCKLARRCSRILSRHHMLINSATLYTTKQGTLLAHIWTHVCSLHSALTLYCLFYVNYHSKKKQILRLLCQPLLYSSLIINDQILPPNPCDDIANILRKRSFSVVVSCWYSSHGIPTRQS
jgi:hypothetical protein